MEPETDAISVSSVDYVPAHKAPSDLLQEVRLCVHELMKCKQTPIKGLPQLTKLRDLYYDKTTQHYRREIGDVLAECGYSACTWDMLEKQSLNGYYSEGFNKLKTLNMWKTTRFLLDNTLNYSDASPHFAQELGNSNILELLCFNLKKFPVKSPEKKSKEYFVIEATLYIMNNIARRPENKHFFGTEAKKLVFEFKFSQNTFLKVLSLTTLAFIINANESLQLTEDKDTIHTIIHWMNLSIEMDEFKPLKEGFTASELAYALDKLAIDGNAQKIIEGHALKALYRMLGSADIVMQINAAKCVWTLAFNSYARKEIKKSENLMATLKRMQIEEQHPELVKNINGAMWLLLEKGDAEPTPVDPNKPQHLFISYCENEKDTVIKIWQKLKESGYDIWIDIEQSSGDILEAMSSAVEQASMIIVCVSEGYKQSHDCRTEARYSYNRRKKFIPLKMQDPYSPDGWLGAIVGSTLYFNFSNNGDFDDSFSKLVREINRRVELPKTASSETQIVPKNDENKLATVTPPSDLTLPETTSSSVSQQTGSKVLPSPRLNPQVLEEQSPSPSVVTVSPSSPSSVVSCGRAPELLARMTKSDVRDWLKENDLETCIPNFKRIDGKLLWELKSMKDQVPETFHDYLKHDLKLSGVDILKFRSALGSLE